MMMIIGHRGGRNLWPENSMLGFKNLAAMPVEGVEFDVHLTNAGELLVIHDATLDRTTNATGLVRDLPAGAHRSVLLKGSDTETIPTLEEVLAFHVAGNLELHVELKADHEGKPYPGLEAMVAAMIDRFGLAERSLLTSFSPDVLAVVRSVAPHIRTLSSIDAKSAKTLGIKASIERLLEVSDYIAVERAVLDPHWDEITAMVPLDRLAVWVPNEDEDLAYWLKKPLRGLTTDRPDSAVRLREGLSA